MNAVQRHLVGMIAVAAVGVGFAAETSAEKPAGNWPGFRGPNAAGIADGYPTPTRWNVPERNNVLWKTPIPGLAHASPVIWGDRVFVVTAVSGKKDVQLKTGLYGNIESVKDSTVHQWLILCVDKKTGKVLWKETAHQGVPRIKRHPKATHANSTPATDGRYLVALLGSEGLFCYDMAGKRIWKRDLGVLDSGYFRAPRAQWGFGSSPVIHNGMVIVQCDVQKGSFIGAFNIRDGKPIWRTGRNEVPTWSTPTIHVTDRRAQVIVNGYRHIGGYDLKTGKGLWRMAGGGDIPIPTPVVGHGLIYITNAHGRSAPLYAVRADAVGDITLPAKQTSGKYVAWVDFRSGAYIQTPLVYGDYLYSCRNSGVLMCYEAKTGRKIYSQRLGKAGAGFSASGIVADGKLYYTSERGRVYVVRPGAKPEILAVNQLGGVAMATPAVSKGVLYFRTRHHLIAVGKRAKGK